MRVLRVSLTKQCHCLPWFVSRIRSFDQQIFGTKISRWLVVVAVVELARAVQITVKVSAWCVLSNFEELLGLGHQDDEISLCFESREMLHAEVCSSGDELENHVDAGPWTVQLLLQSIILHVCCDSQLPHGSGDVAPRSSSRRSECFPDSSGVCGYNGMFCASRPTFNVCRRVNVCQSAPRVVVCRKREWCARRGGHLVVRAPFHCEMWHKVKHRASYL